MTEIPEHLLVRAQAAREKAAAIADAAGEPIPDVRSRAERAIDMVRDAVNAPVGEAVIFYEATKNTDLTEGKGAQVTSGYFRTEEEAVTRVLDKSTWIMGRIPSGSVHRVTIDDEGWGRDRTWGPLAGGGYGFLDGRVDHRADPDYHRYLELKARFEPEEGTP